MERSKEFFNQEKLTLHLAKKETSDFDCALGEHIVRLNTKNDTNWTNAYAWIQIPHNWHCNGCGATHAGSIKYFVYLNGHKLPTSDNQYDIIRDVSGNNYRYEAPVYK